jgi:3-oxoacyl-[acyl-carrier-protein] synthase II
VRTVSRRGVVVTGLGIVSPIGLGIEAFWGNALQGRSGIDWLSTPDLSELPRPCTIVGEVKDFRVNEWMGGMHGRMAGRFTHFAVAATKMALADARLKANPVCTERVKVGFGSSVNGLQDIFETSFTAYLRGEPIQPWLMPEFPVHAATSHITAETGARGHPTSFSSACCAGLDAIGWAARQISEDSADAAIAGASDAPLSKHILLTFHASGTLSKWPGRPEAASRPFDAARSGLVLAEGAATVILEEEHAARCRGVTPYAQVLGFGTATEGGELRSVEASGHAAARAMTMALHDADLGPADIDYICAHGNSMINYDAAETAAIKSAFGSHARSIPISSIKSMCGHALGAASAIQTVATCLVLRDSTVFPTINCEQPDPACDLDYVAAGARRGRIRHAMIHTHSIGGTHLALILGAPR